METKAVDNDLDIDGTTEEGERKAEEGEMNVGGEDFVFPVAKTKSGMLLGRIEQSRNGNRIGYGYGYWKWK